MNRYLSTSYSMTMNGILKGKNQYPDQNPQDDDPKIRKN